MNDKSLAEFTRLSRRASAELPPTIDVTERVLATLSQQPVTQAYDRDLMICGVASIMGAGLALSVLWMGTVDETLLPLVQPFVTILP